MTRTPTSRSPATGLRRLLRYRLALAVLVPVFGLIAFSAYVVFGKLESYRDGADMLRTAQVTRAAHALARELESERGLAALYIGTGRMSWRQELEDQRHLTDEHMAAFRALLSQAKVRELLGRPGFGVELGVIDGLRAGTDGDDDLRAMLEGYGALISTLINTSSKLSHPDTANLIAAYMDLGNIKDRIARARSIGASWLLRGGSDRELMALFAQAHAEKQAFIESFRGHASAEQLQLFDEIVSGPVIDEVARLDALALAGRLTQADADAWHRTHIALVELIIRAEEKLAAQMEGLIQANLRSAQVTFYLVVIGVIALVVFSLESLRRSENRAMIWEDEARKLFRAVEQSPVSVMITDPGGLIEYVNPAFTRMTGFSREEVLGRNPRMLRSEQTVKTTYSAMWHTIQSGAEWRGELVNRRKDGSVYWESMTIAPVKGPNGEVDNYIALKEDITARKQSEEAMLEAREAAELANRAKSEFLATMSHELRTPLNAIIGFSEIIETQLLGPVGQPQYMDYARDINESGRHLLQLINDILDVARLEVGRVALREDRVTVQSALRSCLSLLHERAEAGKVTVIDRVGADLPALYADERRLKQILVNVIGNAIKFTPPGGEVVLDADIADDGMTISVSDTGIGIASEDIAKVMAPFGQADSSMARRYEGSGLGLPLSRKLMDMHDGKLQLASRPGAGTTVTLRFPKERVCTSQPAA